MGLVRACLDLVSLNHQFPPSCAHLSPDGTVIELRMMLTITCATPRPVGHLAHLRDESGG